MPDDCDPPINGAINRSVNYSKAELGARTSTGASAIERLFTDLASGVRMLFRYPTLSLGAIVTLDVGIGLSTTVFCIVRSRDDAGGGEPSGQPAPCAASDEDRSGQGAGDGIIHGRSPGGGSARKP